MYRQFTVQGNRKWFKLLSSLIKKYNNKVHSSIGVSPQEASDNPEKIVDLTYENNYYNEKHLNKRKPKYQKGNRVRIFKYKNKFEKGYVGYWTDEIFKVKEVLETIPRTYRIEDLNNETIIGRFYENELQKTEF
jgi:hypothetical protein